MISAGTSKRIEELVQRYPVKKSALIPALDEAQRANNHLLTKEDAYSVAQMLKVSRSEAWGAATYYTMINSKPVGKYHLQIDTNVPGMLMGADEILAYLEKKLKVKKGQTTADGLFTLSHVEDLGSCGTCPVIQVNDTYYENMTVEKTDALIDSLRKGIMPQQEISYNVGGQSTVLLKNRMVPNARSLEVYRSRGGYEGLAKARAMAPDAVIEQVKASMVRGRGGAGFPAGIKWDFIPKDRNKPAYLICNADEGEPGTFKDRQLMEYDPHLVIEGICIAAHAIDTKQAFIYIRGEYRWISFILEKAIDEAKAASLLNGLNIVVHRGAGSYVCGDETALMESLEGKRGNPRIKPPFPANYGLYGCPTIINNVETLSCLPFIIKEGADAFRKMGSIAGYGPKIFGVSGHVNKPGVYEFPMGTPLRAVLEAAGGVKGNLKGVIVGGLSVPILLPDEAKDVKLDYDGCSKVGTALGSAGIMVINDTVSIPQLALRTISFYAHESCGQCTPCREGSMTIKKLIKRLVEKKGVRSDIDRIVTMCNTISGLTLCPTGDAFSQPIRAMVQKYRSEFEALIR